MNFAPFLLLLWWNSSAAGVSLRTNVKPPPEPSHASAAAGVGREAHPPSASGSRSEDRRQAGWAAPRWKRDPFQPIVPPRAAGPQKLPPGRAGLEVDHLRVVAVALGGPRGPVGMVAGAAGHTYFLKPGDRIFDARVLRLNTDGIWFERIRAEKNASQLVFRKVS